MTDRTSRAPVRTTLLWIALALGILVLAAALWVGLRGAAAAGELRSAKTVAYTLRDQLMTGETDAATASSATLTGHTNRAVELTSDPVWRAAELVPFVGPNLVAVGHSAAAVDILAVDVAAPLIPIVQSLDLSAMAGASVDLAPLAAAAPVLSKARDAAIPARERVRAIDSAATLPFIRDAVTELTGLVESTADTVESLDRAATLLPAMLGGGEPRNYLLLVQNSAELRASGGLVGATAVLTASAGHISVTDQKSTTDFPVLAEPVLPVTPAEANLYGDKLGRYLMDVNLTPDFARSAELALAMAEPVYGRTFDGVFAIDPYVLQRVLTATGPVSVTPERVLDESNAVQVLLSDVYRDFPDPVAQDAFFAAATEAVFAAVTSDSVDPRALVSALVDGASQGRILLWSADDAEQAVLAETTLAGSLPDDEKDFVGVYLNDATGAKMGYYLSADATVDCAPASTGATHRATVTLTSAAPTDAGTSLPAYVTGYGIFGVVAGDTRTQVVVVLPVGASVLSATRGDDKLATIGTDDADRTVATIFTQVSPGESITVTVDFAAAAVDTVAATPGVSITHPKWGDVQCGRRD
ncbi:DUF4012 domain-containing protein [Mycetocola zhadangensis]|uniref:DUF4012 domain-containing protein n=1 Tax=Mycetocola zhadangensis TaxID=1164595 RepID=A0A3L7IWL7_9MICO|nr:DUF4012 domain-containing protein [Mycetocola zhadangensis]RLQ82624.1 DUF4012 domain-containing protein [Mycetocola zhadangensis]GGE99744.1 hypothetical protein GCM10011313_23310 [Mycetocola zhadangensis]